MSPDAEGAAAVILMALEDSYVSVTRRRLAHLGEWQQVTGEVSIPGIIHIAWTWHWQRLSGKARPQVLTIAGIEIAEELRNRGIGTSMVRQIVAGDLSRRIPLRFLHFKECGPGLSRLLEREGFNRYEVGPAVDWWHPITGQKELGL